MNYNQINLIETHELKKYMNNIKDNNIKIEQYPIFFKNKCFRCGNSKLVYNQNKLLYCDNCLEFGRVIEGKVFIAIQIIQTKKEKIKHKLDELKLSTNQLLASKYIDSSINMKQNVLIHAVCGAGKTEIVFNTIYQNLQKNKYIAFLIPRIDILYEVAESLRYYFPQTKISIYNGQEDCSIISQIYVMTTNQIIKFKNIFNLIIVDEVDAFPYEYNIKYDYGVENALNPKGNIIYLTSTPSHFLLNKKINLYKIKRRWHNHLLPVPKFIYCKIDNYYKKNNKLVKLLEQYQKETKQVLLFVANISLCKKIKKELNNQGFNAKYICSKSENRQEIIKMFKEFQIKILITTPILERGVTFKYTDVIVLDSSSKLYNVASLVQIAGRVNRHQDYQDGKVYFFHQGITKTMEKANKMIIEMNK